MSARSRRGRPTKFGRPGQVVALTLPASVVRGLRRIDRDLGWAIVTLFEKQPGKEAVPAGDVELVSVGDGRSLIAVNPAAVRRLAGVHLIPIGGARALLALEPGRGLSDLELTVIDRLDQPGLRGAERRRLARVRAQLRAWRRSRALRFFSSAIIEAERAADQSSAPRSAIPSRAAASDRRRPRTRR